MAEAVDKVLRSPAGSRARMAAKLARLRARRDPATAALERALAAVALGRIPAEERRWGERIEGRRGALMSEQEITEPPFDPGTDEPEEAVAVERTRTTVGFASAIMSLPPVWCSLLTRLVRERRPRRALELGTGFGISTAYQAAAIELNGHGTLTTLEGSQEWAELAGEGLGGLGLAGVVEQRTGPIAETLPAVLAEGGEVEYAFIDAEHQAQPTIDHFEAIAPRLAAGAIVVLDDVDWPQMRPAWARIAGDPRITSPIAMGRIGIAVARGPGAAAP